MAKHKSKKMTGADKFNFPLKKTNFIILGVGAAIVVLGYVIMAFPSNPDAFLTRTLSPIVLVFAYLVVIPIGILYRGNEHDGKK